VIKINNKETMNYNYFKKNVLLLMVGGLIGTASIQAQVQSVLKVGDNPYTISDKAALDIESVTKGILPPRMTLAQRDAIVKPPAGLLVWCTNSNVTTEPATGELCVSLGEDKGWVPFTFLTDPRLMTYKKTDTDTGKRPVKLSETSATINGKLLSSPGSNPTESGFLVKEVVSNDFGTLPLLDAVGAVSGNTVKVAITPTATVANGAIAGTVILSSTANPYFIRSYAKTALGIGYGNTILFNLAAPKLLLTSPITGKDGSLLEPIFNATITVNAGTPTGKIVDFGYCVAATANPTTQISLKDEKVDPNDALSVTKLAQLEKDLAPDFLTANATVSLSVTDYVPTVTTTTYVRFYAKDSDGVITYSNEVSFVPGANPVTGGTAIATYKSTGDPTATFKIGAVSTATFPVTYTVTRKGTYAAITPGTPLGNTKGLALATVPAGSFAATGDQTITFSLASGSATPTTALSGASFPIPGVTTAPTTGLIAIGTLTGGNAICNGLYDLSSPTPVTSTTGKVWMDRNLGASRAATSSTDFNAYGCLFQWGRGNDGHASITWTTGTAGTVVNSTTTTLSVTDTPANALYIRTNAAPNDWRSSKNDLLWQGVAGINNPCPTGYRVPTDAEITTEVGAYTITNAATAYTSPLKFVVAGNRDRVNGSLLDTGANGFYWSSSVSGTNASFRFILSGSTFSTADVRSYALSLRCLKD
jgi:hypothetical protein